MIGNAIGFLVKHNGCFNAIRVMNNYVICGEMLRDSTAEYIDHMPQLSDINARALKQNLIFLFVIKWIIAYFLRKVQNETT